MKKILIIDAHGGGIGKQVITKIKEINLENIKIYAVGTNSMATLAMLKAGADEAATGENSIVVASKMADIIIGPIGMVIADALLGEITPKMALSIGQSSAKKILIPFNSCDNIVAGLKQNINASMLIDDVINKLIELLKENC